METILPVELRSRIERDWLKARRKRSRHLVVAGPREHRIIELSEKGFVVEADDLPHLRGFVEIMRGRQRVSRRLAVFAWARDGMVGYEFKHEHPSHIAPADYERPETTALIGAPEEPRAS